jgi:hypothetical protein
VLSNFGHGFERAAILEGLTSENEGCPLTRKPLRISHLMSNVKLKRKIDEWKQMPGYHNIPSEYMCPLSNVKVTHPLITRYGDNFERSAIFQWFDAGFDVCPPYHEPTFDPIRALSQYYVVSNDSKVEKRTSRVTGLHR